MSINASDVERAWAAGLFEGEGCFSTVRSLRSHGRVALRASLGMTDEDTVRRFHAIVGVGAIHVRHRAGVKSHWIWQVHTIEGFRHVFGLLEPWLGDRRRARATELIVERDEYESRKPAIRAAAARASGATRRAA